MSQMDAEPLSPLTKLAYGVGDFGFSFTDTALGTLFGFFLLDAVGLTPAQVALAVWIGKVWDWINDPIIGHIADRTRTRWGRRRPYLLFGFLPFGLAFMMLWWRPPFENPWALTAYYAVAYFFYDTILTFVSMPFFALTPELTQDYDERTSLTSYRMAFSLVGGLVAFVVPLMIIGTMRPENADRVFLMGALFGILSGLPLLFTFIGTRERPEFVAQPLPSFGDSFRAVRHNRPFWFATGIFLFTWTAVEIIQALLLLFLKYRMRLEEESEIVAGTIFVTAMIVLPFWVWISHRADKRKAYIFGMLFLSTVMIAMIFMDPSLGFGSVLGIAAFAGVGVSAVHVLPWAMIPDAIEVDQLESGARHEGMFYALVSLFKKWASTVAMPLTFLVLGWSGYASNAAVQTPKAEWAIRILIGPVPSLFLLGGILFALYYPLSRELHTETRKKIAARKVAGSE